MSASVAPDALAVSRSVVRRRRRFSAGRLAAHAVLIATTLTILLPLLWIARTSIVSRRVAYLIPPDWAAPFNLDSWAYIFGDQNFIRFFVNSLGIGVGTALLSLLVGVPAAYSIARFRTGGQTVRVGILATQILPPITLVIPVFILARDTGLLNNQGMLAVMYLSFNLPFVVWILSGFFQGLPQEVEEAALVDGATRLQVLRLVVVPMALPGLIAAGVFSFILAWNEFLFAFILTGIESRTLPVALVGLITQAGTQVGPMAAGTVLMSVPVIALTFMVRRYLVSGLTFGSVK
ncbi:MAG: binding-protein-dependent transport system inner membrane component [Chloroflexi bacterium CSP1-4]|nr:MAG: binding-protein-dependent transport system inner membrane component [Chloroflexi bacterium CSP1-4]